MNEYTDQPKEHADRKEIRSIIENILKGDLPECTINEWFIASVHFANMLDAIIDKIEES